MKYRGVWDGVMCFTVVLVLLQCSIAVAEVVTCSGIVPLVYRNDKISINDFGVVGDRKTLNTKAFREVIYRIEHLRRRGGTLLYIPSGHIRLVFDCSIAFLWKRERTSRGKSRSIFGNIKAIIKWFARKIVASSCSATSLHFHYDPSDTNSVISWLERWSTS